MHFQNSMFGHGRTLCAYMGEPDRILPGYVQHGWGEIEAMSPAPYLPWLPKLVWSKRSAHEARRDLGGRVEPIGAAFLYLEGAQAPPLPVIEREQSTIVYPFHVWDYDDADPALVRPGPSRDDDYHDGHARFAREIAERESGPVTVSLYWRDNEDERVRAAYLERGFRVVCYGSRFDADFLVRQRIELARHRRFVTNRLGSGQWYAGHLGLELAVYGPFPGSHPDEARVFRALQAARWPSMFADAMSPDEARQVSDDELGLDCKREPDELRELLGLDGWRGRFAGQLDLIDRFHHRLRWGGYLRRAAGAPPFWEGLLERWGVADDPASPPISPA